MTHPKLATTATPQSAPVPSTVRSTSAADNSTPTSKSLGRLEDLIPLRSGMTRKASIDALKPWVALSLSLDGRDKITKIMQYLSRLLAWRCEGLAAAVAASAAALSSPSALSNHEWLVLATKFRSAQAKLTESRKAYRLGRSLVELHRLRNLMGKALLPLGTMPDLDNVGRRLPSAPIWKLLGSAMKLLGLMGFWAGDNVSFLVGTGVLDPFFSISEGVENGGGIEGSGTKVAQAQRTAVKKRAGRTAARFYFAGAVAGLTVTAREWWGRGPNGNGHTFDEALRSVGELEERLRELKAEKGKDDWGGCNKDGNGDGDKQFQLRMRVIRSDLVEARARLEAERGAQFVRFLAFLKSCCDVLVFSNNPGVDLHLQFRGHKMNEGFHSVCGLLSASTVIYNNFPDKSSPKDG